MGIDDIILSFKCTLIKKQNDVIRYEEYLIESQKEVTKLQEMIKLLEEIKIDIK